MATKNPEKCNDDKCSEILNYKKYKNYCSKCGKVYCDRHIYFYVDGNNIAITRNAPPLCWACSHRPISPERLKEIQEENL